MTRLRIGIVRYASVGAAIAQALGVDPAPDCRIGQGRITITFRSLGASRWPGPKQIEYALQTAAIARAVLARDPRPAVRQRAANRAVVVVYEDAAVVRGCSVVAQWNCVVPANPTADD
ncbi:MAG: hypothetical protein ACJ79I_06460 [Gemmatimonadaceae bacterium]